MARLQVQAELHACSFEVVGKVQKVFFRKYCTEQAQALGIRGWVMNTPRGTVVGELQGSADAMANMKAWLSTKGSPKSVIEKVVFTGERTISNYTFACFEFRR